MVMHHPVIHKPGSFPVPPNIPDHEAMLRSFRWDEIERELDWLPGGGLNIAHEAIDRHCAQGRATERVATPLVSHLPAVAARPMDGPLWISCQPD